MRLRPLHFLGVAADEFEVPAEFAQRVLVMYAGRVIEQAPVAALFDRPMHPYTDGLIDAVPKLDGDLHRLTTIPGSIPDLATVIPGCRFNPRCREAMDACRRNAPALLPVGPDHLSRCPPRAAARGVA